MMSHAGVHEEHSKHCFDLLTKKFQGAPKKRKMQTKVTNTKESSKKQKTPDSSGAGPSAPDPAVDTVRPRRQCNQTQRFAPHREGRNDKKLKESD